MEDADHRARCARGVVAVLSGIGFGLLPLFRPAPYVGEIFQNQPRPLTLAPTRAAKTSLFEAVSGYLSACALWRCWV